MQLSERGSEIARLKSQIEMPFSFERLIVEYVLGLLYQAHGVVMVMSNRSKSIAIEVVGRRPSAGHRLGISSSSCRM